MLIVSILYGASIEHSRLRGLLRRLQLAAMGQVRRVTKADSQRALFRAEECAFLTFATTPNPPGTKMAIVLDGMALSLPHSRPTTPNSDVMTEETPCQRLVRTTVNIKRFTTTRDGYKQILTSLESDANHDPTNALYVKIQKEYEEISALLENGVSDFGSVPRCTTIGCQLHTSHAHKVNFHLALLHTHKNVTMKGLSLQDKQQNVSYLKTQASKLNWKIDSPYLLQ
ncbi:hypothetical protein TNCV_3965751 [Trichonephila clavipes]|nr:hypothetical protein TNCV_3965751 [Trichonephila clavipes]